jgi:predicted Zn-dependent peptidase
MAKNILKVSTLGNGMIVGTDKVDGKLSREDNPVSFCLLTAAGTAVENHPGVAHFHEHMMFKGTNTRDALQVSEGFEMIGGQFNAETNHEYTMNTLNIRNKHRIAGLELFADINLNPTFPSEEVTIERKTIFNEFTNDFDNAEDYIDTLTDQSCFKDSPYARPILGTKKGIKNTTRKHVEEFWQNHYSQSQKILVVTGEVDHQEIVDKANSLFGHLKFPESKAPIVVFSPNTILESRPIEHVEAVLSFKGVGHNHKDLPGLVMLSTMMSGGLSSRLVQEIREKRGLTYHISADACSFDSTGLFQISWATVSEDMMRVVPLVCEELLTAGSTKKFTEKEFLRAKEQLLREVSFEPTEPPASAETIIFDLFARGKVTSSEESIKKIKEIELDSVNKLATRIFTSEYAYAAIGPKKEIYQSHEWLTKHYRP